MSDAGTAEVSTAELLGSGRVVLFGVPAAFSPTCSDAHLPGFSLRSEELFAKGVDTIACVSVNDAFVMSAWKKDQDAEHIVMIAGSTAAFTKALGLEFDDSGLGLRTRSQRYQAIIQNGILQSIAVDDDPTQHTVSSVAQVLAAL